MSTQLVVGGIGALIGGYFGGPQGAAIGWSLGSYAGAALDPPKGPDGPRLEERGVTASTYGIPLPRIYGVFRVPGNIIWATDLQETAAQQGGKGSPEPTSTTYSYSASFAVSLCSGPIVGVRRIWADGNLIYDQSDINTEQPEDFEAESMVVYQGTETQEPDPSMQAALGDVPAYRGQAYVVFTNLQVARYGNRIPTLSFEVVAEGSFEERGIRAIRTDLGQDNRQTVVDPDTGYVWGVGTTANNRIVVTDPITGERVADILIPVDVVNSPVTTLVYIPEGRVFWAIRASGVPAANIIEISADALTVLREFPGPSVYLGAGLWNPFRVHVILGRQNFIFTEFYVYGVNGAAAGPIRDHGVYMSESAMIMEEAAFYMFDGADLAIVSAVSYDLLLRVPLGYGLSTYFDRRITYDSRRRRLLVSNYVGAGVIEYTAVQFPQMVVSQGTYEAPVGIISMQGWTYHAPSDQILVGTSPLGNDVAVYDAATFTLQRFLDNPLTNLYGLVPAPGLADRLYGHSGPYVVQVSLDQALTPEGVPLSEVVTRESALVGLEPDDIDVSQLTGVSVTGYAVQGAGTVRSNIEQLMMAYLFDAVESGGKVKFVLRGGPSAGVIELEDLAAHEPGGDVPTPVPITRGEEIEMPASVTIRYSNPEADYQIGAQSARRLTGKARADQVTELPMVLSDSQARRVAEAGLYSAWAARVSWQFITTLKHSTLEPTDVVEVAGNKLRISRRVENGGLITFEGVYESGEVYAQDILGVAATTPTQTIPSRTRTQLHFLDVPPLRDEDDNAAFYIAANGYQPGFGGAVVYKSVDAGNTYSEHLLVPSQATVGYATTVLGAWESNTFDEVNSVTLRMRTGTLASTSERGVLNGFNIALLGSEILQWRRATLNADGSYTLRGLLRGRKRTPTSGHAAGDRFIVLTAGTLRRTPPIDSEIGQARLYRGVSIGATLASAATVGFTNTARALMPLAPVHLGGGRSSAGNVLIKWTRCNRLGAAWRNFTDVAMSEASESYQVDIHPSAAYGTPLRTLSSATPSVTYTAAQQVTDFGSNQAQVWVSVHQISAAVGRGDPLRGSV